MEWGTFTAVVDGLTGGGEGPDGRDGPGGEAPPAVAFMGLGEPLLHPRFLDMVRLARRRGLRAEVTTNALLLDDELAAGLLEAGLDQLVVSIDGASAETFGRVRSGASLDRVVENVRRLHVGRGPNYGPGISIGVEFVAMRSNVAELPGLRPAGRATRRDVRHRQQRARLHAGTAGRDAVRPLRELTRRRRDHGRAALAAARVRLGRAARRGAGRGAHPLRARLLLRRRARVDAQPLPLRGRGRVRGGLARRRQPVPALAAHVHLLRARPREAHAAVGGGQASGSDAGGGVGGAGVRRVPRPVRRFDFPPCTDCGCELAETNEEDCLGNPHPTCGDCLWARGVVRCA